MDACDLCGVFLIAGSVFLLSAALASLGFAGSLLWLGIISAVGAVGFFAMSFFDDDPEEAVDD